MDISVVARMIGVARTKQTASRSGLARGSAIDAGAHAPERDGEAEVARRVEQEDGGPANERDELAGRVDEPHRREESDRVADRRERVPGPQEPEPANGAARPGRRARP